MRKQYKKIVTLAAALCAMILLGSQAVLAASYPLLIAKTSLLTCEEGEKVSLQYYYYPQYVNEKIESTIYDPTGAAVAQSSDTKYNTTAQLSTYTLTWDTTGMEGGRVYSRNHNFLLFQRTMVGRTYERNYIYYCQG